MGGAEIVSCGGMEYSYAVPAAGPRHAVFVSEFGRDTS